MSHVVALVTSSPALREAPSERALPKDIWTWQPRLWSSALAAEADWVWHMRNDKPAARQGSRTFRTPNFNLADSGAFDPCA